MNRFTSFNFGIENEVALLPKIQAFFNDETIRKTSSNFCPFDYEGNTGLYELKTRRCKRTSYATTIFPGKKLRFQPNKPKILLFSFVDGDFYIPYTPELFGTFQIENKQFRHDRGNIDTAQEYIHIPVEQLLPIAV